MSNSAGAVLLWACSVILVGAMMGVLADGLHQIAVAISACH